ncbi:hypothetical protein [Proteiniborus sp. MB09-C3]|nr:hypothetical protein [Proteiniborus sp. MB09-C3]WIV10528.1 hypothetical protein QO263_10185 [Proteiniborus sp. MB09-C3]
MEVDLDKIIKECKERNKKLRKMNREWKIYRIKRAIRNFFRKIFW